MFGIAMNRNDRVLDQIEDSIKKLKLEYDIYFNGGCERWPEKAHENLTLEIKRQFNVTSLTYAQRFRLNSLALRLNAYGDLWKRNLRLLEQGRKPTIGIIRPTRDE